MADAVQAGLPKRNPNYTFYPQRMLPARARAFFLRDTFGDVLLGIPIKEDIEDAADHDIIDPPATSAQSLAAEMAATPAEPKKRGRPAKAEPVASVTVTTVTPDQPVITQPEGSTMTAADMTPAKPDEPSAQNETLAPAEPEANPMQAAAAAASTAKPADDPAEHAKAFGRIRDLRAELEKKDTKVFSVVIDKHGLKGKPPTQCTVAELFAVASDLQGELNRLNGATEAPPANDGGWFGPGAEQPKRGPGRPKKTE